MTDTIKALQAEIERLEGAAAALVDRVLVPEAQRNRELERAYCSVCSASLDLADLIDAIGGRQLSARSRAAILRSIDASATLRGYALSL